MAHASALHKCGLLDFPGASSRWHGDIAHMTVAYALIILVICAEIVFVVRQVRNKRMKNLSDMGISDHVALLVNLILLGTAVIALQISLSAYNDAHKSGDEQLRALAAARQAIVETGGQQVAELNSARAALNSVVDIAGKQRTLLEGNLKTSAAQLSIIRQQQARELAQPDVDATIVNPTGLGVIVHNTSKIKVARDVKYQVILKNLDHPYLTTFQIVSGTLQEVDYIRPDGNYLPTTLQFISSPASPAVENGNRLFGYLTVQCPDCKRMRVYWILWRYGVDGWYHEGTPTEYPMLYGLDQQTAAVVVQIFMKHPSLTSIPSN